MNKDLERKDKHRYFAVENDQVIGYGFLWLTDKPTKKHTAGLGIVVSDGYQNKGIGKQLVQSMIKSAWDNGLSRVWLNVYEDNPHAYHLYESLGFKKEGMFMYDEITQRGPRNTIAMAILREKS